MSGLGEAASIAGLISVAGQAVQATSALYTFIQTYKHVKPKLLEIADEISQLQKTIVDIQAIANRAAATPEIDRYCVRLHEKLTTCQGHIRGWKEKIHLELKAKGRFRAGNFLKKVKIAADRDFFGDIRAQIIRMREEMIIELSILQSASACVLVQTSNALSSSVHALGNDQRHGFALLAQGVQNRDHIVPQVADLTAVERRLEDLALMLRHSPIADVRAPLVQDIPQDILAPRLVICDVCQAHDNARELTSYLEDTESSTRQVMRLVRPAILTYEQKGGLKQVLMPLTIEGFDSIPINRRLALLEYILRLRLFFWLIDRIQVHGSTFAPRAQRSILYEESRMASAWDFHFSCFGIANGQQFPVHHLFCIFMGSADGVYNMLTIIERLDRDFGGMLKGSIALGAQTYLTRINNLSNASKLIENELKRVEQQHQKIEGRIQKIQDRLNKDIEYCFALMDTGRASTTTLFSQGDTTLARAQAQLMVAISHKNDLELNSQYFTMRNLQVAQFTNSYFELRSWFNGLISSHDAAYPTILSNIACSAQP